MESIMQWIALFVGALVIIGFFVCVVLRQIERHLAQISAQLDRVPVGVASVAQSYVAAAPAEVDDTDIAIAIAVAAQAR